MRRAAPFIFPLAVWVFVLRDFIFGTIPLNMDTNTIYGVTKFYFNNLLNGVLPLWDPFTSLGHPFYALSICNLFNPITLLVPLLKLLGINYHLSFNAYLVAYFGFGCLGFYFLTKQLFGSKPIAYIGYIAFMFSSLGVSLFTQFTFVEMIVGAVWLFYFIFAFAQHNTRGNFVGLIASSMTILGAYLPFYTATVVAVFILSMLLLYSKVTIEFVLALITFCRKNLLLFLLGVMGLAAAAGPLLAYRALDQMGDSVSPGRHCQYASAQECYERTLNHQGGMLYEEITRSGSLGERLDLGYLFFHLDKITYGSDSLFFLPSWVYIVVILSLLLRLDRMNVLLLGMGLMISLIALGDAAGVHRFLYEHVFFFKYFRNLFFFQAFLIPIVLVFFIKQLKVMLDWQASSFTQAKFVCVMILLVHALMAFWLYRNGSVMGVMYMTLLFSVIGMVMYAMGISKKSPSVWKWAIVILLMVQPITVMCAYSANAREFMAPLPSQHVRPTFAWQRPEVAASSKARIYQFVPYEDFWYAMSMTDATAKLGYPQSASRYSFDLAQRMGEEQLAAYARYKVYLYPSDQAPIIVTGPRPDIDIESFDVNRVRFKTNFMTETLLVYNDSYTKSWKALIDGEKVEIQRSNEAFKGVQVPPGNHIVEFLYDPPGGVWVYILATGAMIISYVLCGLLLWRKQ